MVITAQVHATFEPVSRSVAAARSFVRETLVDWDATDIVDDAVLLVSELVTNAIVHAGTTTAVACLRYEEGVRIEVTDRHPTRRLPTVPAVQDEAAEGGRGLLLSASLASAWGVEYTQTAKQVWFRLDLPGHAINGATSLASPVAPTVALPTTPQDVRVAAIRVDADGRIREWNAEATALFGWSADEAARLVLADLVAWPQARTTSTLTLTDMLELSRWQGEYEIRHHDGHTVPIFASHLRTTDLGDTPSVTCLIVHASHRALLEAPPARIIQGTAPAAYTETDAEWAGLSDSVTNRIGLDELLQRTVERARDALDGDAAYILLVSDEETELEVRAATGLPSGTRDRSSGIAVEETAGRIGAARLPAVHDDLGPAATDVPVLFGSGMRSLVTVPLMVEGRVTGTLGVASLQPGWFSNDDAIRLQHAADRISLSVESARLAELERLRRGSLSFLAEASDLLAGTLDHDRTLAMVAQLVVPRLANWCAVHTVSDTGEPKLSYVWHEDESHIDPLRDLLHRAAPPEQRAVSGARPWRGFDKLPQDYSVPESSRKLRTDAMIALPLVARNRGIGTLVLGRHRGDGFRRDVVDLAEDLSRRAALALDNARLYSDLASTSQALQRSLLPPALPYVPGVEIGEVYQASGEVNEVGGDFYDVFTVAENRWGFAIGDVCGTGPEAAAVTGLARHALRLLAREGQPVPVILSRLNAAILDEGSGRFLTALYGELVPRDGGGVRITMVSAGHPLPLRLRPSGEVETVGRSQPLLGVLEELEFEPDVIDLDPGDVLLAVTDGVTERREGSRMLGEDGLARVLTGCSGLTAGAVAARVQRAVATFAPEAPRDDMAILTLRVL